MAQVSVDTRTPSQAVYKLHIAGPEGTSESVEMQQDTPTRYSGTFQTHSSGAYIVTAQREDDDRRRTEVLSLSYPAEYAEFGVDTALLKMLAAGTAGIHDPTLTQITSPAGVPVEKQVSLAQAFLIAAAILFVLEMILRRYSITNRRLTTFLERLLGKPTDTQAIHTTTDTVSVNERIRENTASAQPAEAAISRLLAAKKRVR